MVIYNLVRRDGRYSMKNDDFANIAAGGMGGRMELLHSPEPKQYEKRTVELKSGVFEKTPVTPKICTKEELLEALEAERERYKPFLENHAPAVKSYCEKTVISEFQLDGETVTIPHYGGPRGYAKKVYISEFEVNLQKDKAVYICFKGVDYIASVYINDECVGKHEGFFSPFEYNIDGVVKDGKNTLKVIVENDFTYGGGVTADNKKAAGDKLYAATGLGWDDPEIGWHHCPPGMGIYGEVSVEVRNRVNITDIFVREGEAWVEVENADYFEKNVEFLISIYGQNIKETVLENDPYVPFTTNTVGMGDSLTEASLGDSLGKAIPMPSNKGKNLYVIPLNTEDLKRWDLETPYLYQFQVQVLYEQQVMDCKEVQFGVRSFTQDTHSEKKGMFYLNGRPIRLRGANTMGFEQQDVLRKDFDQLIDDILLAKLCNMNFLRITQRPVQDEVYEYCDKLGLMVQTDLPLFGCMRRTRVPEGIRQCEEMERMIRNHPCCIVVSYINEPFPNASNKPHRHLKRTELEQFFDACDIVVKLSNPDRIIKHVDGDYDPPSKTLPDNHCYPMWYNGHGIDIGRLHKGYWLPVKPGWYYGCGEFGIEGLDPAEVMLQDYPKEWLKEPFDPCNIIRAQTGSFYYFFYDKGEGMEDWIRKSQRHQEFSVRMMTESFRRNPNMITMAVHLFIDAWPSGWMKTIMDWRRTPKPAYFAYRNALEPMMVSLRSDRFTYFAGEKISVECYVCNDTMKEGKYKVVYELTDLFSGSQEVMVKSCDVAYAGNAEFTIESVDDRKEYTLKAILLDEEGRAVTYNTFDFEVFEDKDDAAVKRQVTEEDGSEAGKLPTEFMKLETGEYDIAGSHVVVKPCGMLPVHFVSRKTGHKAVEEFRERDFSYWYNREADMITPLCAETFTAEGFTPILTSGNQNEHGEWRQELACAEKIYEGKRYVITTVDLRCENPVAKRFLQNLTVL